MRSYEQIWDDATDQAAFSTGTDGDIWMEHWCLHCDREPDCLLLTVAMSGRTPAEWLRTPGESAYTYTQYQD